MTKQPRKRYGALSVVAALVMAGATGLTGLFPAATAR
jgi:hypothetical protein